MAQNELILKAAECVGGCARLARLIGVKPPTVYQWVSGDRPVPALRCRDIERVTNGVVTREELRPDIFGEQAA